MSAELPASAYGSGTAPPAGGSRTVSSAPIPEPKCWRCHRTLAEFLTPPYSLRCQRCKAQNRVDTSPGGADLDQYPLAVRSPLGPEGPEIPAGGAP